MNDLEIYFRNNQKRLIEKPVHYFDIYDRHFNRYRNKDVVIVEIGVFQGGSLQMWKDYFGDKAKIYGIDIDPRCKSMEEENITILIGSQSDRIFLKSLQTQIPPIDILIDDGGHAMIQQIITYEELFPHIKEDGIYLCEDLCTSYWLEYGGGYKYRGSFIEYSKRFIDYLNAYHSRSKRLSVNKFTASVDSIHYYDSVIVIEKKRRDSPPQNESFGVLSFESSATVERTPLQEKLYQLKVRILFPVNALLRFFGIKRMIWFSFRESEWIRK